MYTKGLDRSSHPKQNDGSLTTISLTEIKCDEIPTTAF